MFSLLKDEIRAEEDINSYLAFQTLSTGGNAAVNQFWMEGFGRPRYPWQFPRRLEEISQIFHGSVPSAEDLIYNHTRYLLYAPFLPEIEAWQLFMRHLNGMEPLPSGMHPGNRLKGRRAVCPDCIKEDISYGRGYVFFRRAHLAPGIVVCSEHETSLFDVCEACSNNRKIGLSFETPNLRCRCGGEKVPIRKLSTKQLQVEVAIAKMADQLLKDQVFINLDDWSLPAAIRRYMGSATHGFLVKNLRDILNDELGERLVKDFKIEDETLLRLVGGNVKVTRPKNPIRNIAVISAVFGSWANMAEYLPPRTQGQSEVNADGEPDAEKEGTRLTLATIKAKYIRYFDGLSEEASNEVRKVHRTWLKTVCDINQKITRSGLMNIPGAAPMLLHLYAVDKPYIDEVLVSAEASVIKNKRKFIDGRIEFAVEGIYKRRDRKISATPLVRIKKTHLLKHGYMRLPFDVENSKEVTDAYYDCIDDDDSYRERVINTLLPIAMELRPKSALAEESSWFGISMRTLSARIRVVKQWEYESQR